MQIVYGFIMGFAHMGYDVLHELSPSTPRAPSHTNLLVVWLLRGFMGAAYYIIPEECRPRTRLAEARLRAARLASSLVGVTAIIGFHFNWWEGRKFLEIPRPLDYLVVVNVLLFLANIGMTDLERQALHHDLHRALHRPLCAALLYLPGMITFDNQTLDSFYRWWVVHLWVEGVWELIMGGILSLTC